MLNTLDKIKKEFSDSIDNIISFINFIETLKATKYHHMKKSKFYKDIENLFIKVKSNLSNTKIVQYNAIIISLYGAYELAIKNSTNNFIKFCINNNFNLTENLTKNYLISVSKTFERNSAEDNLNIIRDLNDFLNNKKTSKFRMDLSLNTNQNLKISAVQQIASLVDMKDFLNSTKHSCEFENYIKERQGLLTTEEARQYIDTVKNPFQYIDETVESRNRIAHKGYEENMLDNDMITKFIINEFKIFVFSYIDSLKTQWCKLCLENNTNINELRIIDIFNNNIICFNTQDYIIDKNTVVIVKDSNGNYRLGKILSIQNEHQDISVSTINQDIGCKLDITCKTNYKYYIYSNNEQ